MEQINYCNIQRALIQTVEDILQKENNIRYSKEETGGDYHYIFYKGTLSQFTMEICLESTEFYRLPMNRWFHADDNDYINKVVTLFNKLIKDSL